MSRPRLGIGNYIMLGTFQSRSIPWFNFQLSRGWSSKQDLVNNEGWWISKQIKLNYTNLKRLVFVSLFNPNFISLIMIFPAELAASQIQGWLLNYTFQRKGIWKHIVRLALPFPSIRARSQHSEVNIFTITAKIAGKLITCPGAAAARYQQHALKCSTHVEVLYWINNILPF